MHSVAGGKATEPKVPADLHAAFADAPSAGAAWRGITPIARRDFVRWVTSAKQPETRKRRIAVACSKLASGDRRPCCYAVVPMPLYRALGANSKAKAQWHALTPDERRDFVDAVDAAKDPEARRHQIARVCAALAAGKRHP
jgi:uncharacterized protein YdeI (YjbR/CyaY-like superfamily)